MQTSNTVPKTKRGFKEKKKKQNQHLKNAYCEADSETWDEYDALMQYETCDNECIMAGKWFDMAFMIVSGLIS